jgi:hypothetical protein
MFLRCKVRRKDGKQHRYWSVVENTRVAGGRVVQRHVLYLGEINDTQELAWRRSIAVLEDGAAQPRTLSLFPEDRCEGLLADASIVRVKLSELRLRRPRQWGACWLVLLLWRELQLDQFWSKRLGVKGTRWDQVLFVLVAYRLLAPGSEWRLHREWFQRSAVADLLGEDAGLAEIHKLYRCHDRLLSHKQAVFDHLVGRWRDLFNISYDVLLYDLTSTYFEADPPFPKGDKRRFGYSRDHRPDCVQIVIALVVTPEGLPLAYEVLPGNTADRTTLRPFLEHIERQYGKARRVWLMDRGVPTEEVLAEMRAADPPVHYLVYRVQAWRVAGAAVAGSAIFFPSFLMMLLVLPLLRRLKDLQWLRAFMRGVGPAVIGALAVSLVQMAPHAAPDVFTWILLALTICILLLRNVGPLPLMAGGAAIGLLSKGSLLKRIEQLVW